MTENIKIVMLEHLWCDVVFNTKMVASEYSDIGYFSVVTPS